MIEIIHHNVTLSLQTRGAPCILYQRKTQDKFPEDVDDFGDHDYDDDDDDDDYDDHHPEEGLLGKGLVFLYS